MAKQLQEQPLQENPVKRLEAGIAAVKDAEIAPPDSPIIQGQVHVGNITDLWTQRLYAYYRQISDEHEEVSRLLNAEVAKRAEAGKSCDGYCTCTQCWAVAEAEIEEAYIESVGSTLWAAIMKNLPSIGKLQVSRARKNGVGIAVRGQDCQIVILPPRPPRGFVLRRRLFIFGNDGKPFMY